MPSIGGGMCGGGGESSAGGIYVAWVVTLLVRGQCEGDLNSFGTFNFCAAMVSSATEHGREGSTPSVSDAKSCGCQVG